VHNGVSGWRTTDGRPWPQVAITRPCADSDFWNKLVITDSVRLVLLAMPGHVGNVYALKQLRNRAFAGHIAAIVDYPDEVVVLRELGANEVFHIYDEAGTAFADDAVAGAGRLAKGLMAA
jgi:glutathione-regulated potassium-efflux system ancillary protein KefC